jgi:hypothetical protein
LPRLAWRPKGDGASPVSTRKLKFSLGLRKRPTIRSMERKIFWIFFTVLGLLADVVLPLWWALGASIPIVFVSWWVAYRSGWFE